MYLFKFEVFFLMKACTCNSFWRSLTLFCFKTVAQCSRNNTLSHWSAESCLSACSDWNRWRMTVKSLPTDYEPSALTVELISYYSDCVIIQSSCSVSSLYKAYCSTVVMLPPNCCFLDTEVTADSRLSTKSLGSSLKVCSVITASWIRISPIWIFYSLCVMAFC